MACWPSFLWGKLGLGELEFAQRFGKPLEVTDKEQSAGRKGPHGNSGALKGAKDYQLEPANKEDEWSTQYVQ